MTESTRILDFPLLRRIAPFAWVHRKPLGLALLLLPLTAGMQLVPPYVIKQAIDGPIASGDGSGLGPIALLLLGALVTQYTLQFVQSYAMHLGGQGIVHDLRVAVHGHLLTLHDRYFRKNPAGRLLTRCTNDVEGIGEMFASGFLTLFADLLLLAGICVALVLLNWKLALVTFAVMPALFMVSRWFQVALRGAYREIRARVSVLNAYLQERISGIQVIQLFAREEKAMAEFRGRSLELMNTHLRSIKLDASLFAFVDGTSYLVTALLLWWAAGPIVDDALTLGALVAFTDYVRRFFQPIRDLSQKFAILQSGLASAERVFELLDETEQIVVADSPVHLDSIRGHVRFDDVRFAYVADEPVLRGLTLDVQAGEKVALLGVTGAGKSTALRLINRTYEVNSGAVLLDGIDVRQLVPTELRRAIGVVLQDVVLFKGSVRSNLTLGAEHIDDESIWLALDRVGARAIVERIGGLEGELNEGGRNLSAGERQLLAFARVLVYDPRVLVLDEATSNVDTFSEERIQGAVSEAMEGRTSIVVAHRLSTIQQVDRIVVLKGGRVAEQGTHSELMELGGLYRKLYENYYSGSDAA
ncbi:MAG: ABC transporter ATP-binding protein [Deltaproteobacteria bacterium]|nr:ABC transporter ATP-binding protein [Deltaproteobacteria bacterium]